MPTTQTEDGTDIITPLVHLNGTSAESLYNGYRAAWDALQAAVLATAATAPNARDYYCQSDRAYTMARAEHDKRMSALSTVLEQLALLSTDVMEQQDARVTRARR